ncbi:MAG: adenosylhomocysteine nucleosidase [Chloroflexi bacterium]|jgi:nucleoside phosphorylase|nr:MAG: adenosylhomocysteine nucleosidase [Chloroflexota bacterium]
MTTLAVIAALEAELPKMQLDGHTLVTGTTGIGHEGARSVTKGILDEHGPAAVLSLGFGGGLRDGLEAGSLVVSPRLQVEGQPSLDADSSLLSAATESLKNMGVPFQLGNCLTVDQVAGNAESKAALGSKTGAAVVDMESYWIAWEAAAAGVPWLALRAIVDPLNRALPPFVVGKDGKNIRDWVLPALKYILTTPAGIPNLAWLGLASRKARASIERGVGAILPAILTQLPVTL